MTTWARSVIGAWRTQPDAADQTGPGTATTHALTGAYEHDRRQQNRAGSAATITIDGLGEAHVAVL
jgi:hypothetical protein